MINLSDECKKCTDNSGSLIMCIEICGVPMDILNEYENRRKEKEKDEHDN